MQPRVTQEGLDRGEDFGHGGATKPQPSHPGKGEEAPGAERLGGPVR